GEIALASVLIPGVPNALESLAGWLLFDPGRVTFDSVTGRFGGGTLRAAGTLDLYGETGRTYELQVSADDVAVRYPEGWWLRGDVQAALVSTPDGRQLVGVLALDRAYYVEDVPIGFAQLLQGFFTRRPLLVEETDELVATTELDLQVRGPGALRVRNNVAHLDGDVDLALRGSLARPVLFGAVEVRPGGTLVYSDTEYVVERGELAFANPFRIEPVIDLAARAELRDYDVTLNLSGTLDRLEVAVASDPPLADVDVLTLLAGGEVAAGGPGEAQAGSGVTAAGLLYGQAAAAVGRRVGRLFGFDKFHIDPLTGSRGDLSSARITVGERISRDLYATYSYDPSSSDQQVLQLEWQMSRGLTLVATQNGDGSYALDVRSEKSF
ncbi:MAG: translocation/assembly module TamB domain-containing protein, partial [Thermoanaerobaculia bacterium]